MIGTGDVVADLRRLDPAAGVGDRPLDERAEADMRRMTRARSATAPASNRVGPARRAVLILAAAVVLAVVGAVTGLPGSLQGRDGLAYATPPPLPFELTDGGPATAALWTLERRAGQAQDETSTTNMHVVRTENWSLSSRIDKGGPVRSAVIPLLRELRWNANRSGSLRSVTGPPQFPGPHYERAWEQDGRPGAASTVINDETYGPGQFIPMYPVALAADAPELLRQLSVGHPIAEYGTAELFVAIRDLYLEQTPQPKVRAALFTLLRQRPDIVSLGETVDRTGRAGAAFAVVSDFSGLPTRYVLIFDPSNGRLLASEDVLTTRAGKLNVVTPCVISYTTLLANR